MSYVHWEKEGKITLLRALGIPIRESWWWRIRLSKWVLDVEEPQY